MFSSPEINSIIEKIMAQLGLGKDCSLENFKVTDCNNKNEPLFLSPQKLLVILGLLGNALEVESILINREQIIQIRLDGSLRRKTKLDKMLNEIGAMPFNEILKAILRIS